jgi:hypothetical protein
MNADKHGFPFLLYYQTEGDELYILRPNSRKTETLKG